MTTTKSRIFRQMSKIKPLVLKSRLDTLANVSVEVHYGKTSKCNVKQCWKKTWLKQHCNYIHQRNDEMEKYVKFFLSFMSEYHSSTMSKNCLNLEDLKFFLFSASQTNNSCTSRARKRGVKYWAPLITFNKQFMRLTCRTSKDSWHWKKTWKLNNWFSEKITGLFHLQLQNNWRRNKRKK